MKKIIYMTLCFIVLIPLTLQSRDKPPGLIRDVEKLNAALINAAENGDKRDVQLLLSKGANIEAREASEDKTPLMVAIENKHKEIVHTLLKKGANVNAKTKYGLTPLFFAINSRDITVINLLLDKGAEVKTRIALPQGMYFTPLIGAHVENLPAVAERLSRIGITMTDEDRVMVKKWKPIWVRGQIVLLTSNLKNACIAAQSYIMDKNQIVDSEEKLKGAGWRASENISFVRANMFTTSGEIVLRNERLTAGNSTLVTAVPGEGKIDYRCELFVPQPRK